jgi:erythronate-4-phosphate dehydrogenase
MPGVEQLFGSFGTITRVAGRSIDREVLMSADALLCRSITQVNESLVKGTPVQFVGTATIGTDHLDLNWLKSNQISWANAAGCNAAAVAQYVLSAASYWCLGQESKMPQTSKSLQQLTFGIVGAGNVGTELARCLDLLSINYKLSDPPLELAGDPRQFVSLESILACDVITLHVPLTTKGEHPTAHLLGKKQFTALGAEQLLINASRGAVVDNHALLIESETDHRAEVILDVFEKEPCVPFDVINRCLLATPHIAGHSLEGKLRGSWLIYKSLCKYFDLEQTHVESQLYPAPSQFELNAQSLEKRLLSVYNIALDSNQLKNLYTRNTEVALENIAVEFDRLRKNANKLTDGSIRRDYSGYEFTGNYPLCLD